MISIYVTGHSDFTLNSHSILKIFLYYCYVGSFECLTVNDGIKCQSAVSCWAVSPTMHQQYFGILK